MDTRLKGGGFNEAERKQAALAGPSLPLQFLIGPKPRKKQQGMESFSDSANFHRLHSLLWTFTDPYAVSLLETDERAVLNEFERTFASLPWQPIESHPFISQLPDDDLSPLVEPGRKLLAIIELHRTPREKRTWLQRLWSSKD